MARKHSISNPEAADASRQQWEHYTWLSISKECYKRGYMPAIAYDAMGILREPACPELWAEVHGYYEERMASLGPIDAMAVVRLERGVVTIQWTTTQQHERQQRLADSS